MRPLVRASADRLFLSIRSSALLYRFTLFGRVLLAAGFIPTGIVKLMGQRFTTMGVDSPVGAFFEAMFQTGVYWQFIGLSQVVAGVLLLVPRLAHLGAVMFLPIIVNIVVITFSMDFAGTRVVTTAMLANVLFLCAWDYDRLRPLFTRAPLIGTVRDLRLDRWEAVGFFVFAGAMLAFFGVTRGLVPGSLAIPLVGSGAVAGAGTLGRFIWLSRQGRSGTARGSS